MASSDANMLIDMGFPKERVEKALQVTGNQGVEPAMEWLLAHSDEMDQAASASHELQSPTTETIESKTEEKDSEGEKPGEMAKSIKCEDCGKLFRSHVEVEYHAAKSGHENFAESTEDKKPLTEEEKLEQKRILEQKIKEKKKEREEKEEMEALEREKNRIKSGKEMTIARKKLEDEELKKIVDQRKREKEEDRLARQRVREQIEADKLARKAKLNGTPPTPAPTPPPPIQPAPQKDYTETRLQIRLTNGQTLTQTFGAKEQLSSVRLFVEMNRSDGEGPFQLMTSFPKKIFKDDDFEKPLDVLGLVPSAVVIVSKLQM